MANRFYLFISLLALLGGMFPAQHAHASYKTTFNQALAAYEAGDTDVALSALHHALSRMPPLGENAVDDSNRPFIQYHLARIQAQNGDHENALSTLQVIVAEGIEAPLITQAVHDPAFSTLLETRAWRRFFKRYLKTPLQSQHLGGSVHLISGAGGMMVASIGRDGTLLVDTGYPAMAPAITRALKSLDAPPLRTLINTHPHGDHVGGNARLGGQPVIIAHTATREGMQHPEPFIDITLPAPAEGALPTLTSGQPISLHFNQEEIRIIPLPGHTEGDMIVYFSRSRVLHMGDRYYPNPGQPGFLYPGADLKAFMATLRPLIEIMADDGTVISGHCPPVPFLHLKLSVQTMEDGWSFVAEEKAAGHSVDAIVNAGLPEGWEDWSRGKSEAWVRLFWEASP